MLCKGGTANTALVKESSFLKDGVGADASLQRPTHLHGEDGGPIRRFGGRVYCIGNHSARFTRDIFTPARGIWPRAMLVSLLERCASEINRLDPSCWAWS